MATEEISSLKELGAVPKELSFDKDYSQYGEPVDFFGELQADIKELHRLGATKASEEPEEKIYTLPGVKVSELKLNLRVNENPGYLSKIEQVADKIFGRYFLPSIKENKPVFINSMIQIKDCLPTIFNKLITKTLKSINPGKTEALSDIDTAFREALINFPRHVEAARKGEKIPFLLLIDKEKIQFLLGRLDLPKIGDQDMNELTKLPENPLEESGRGFLMLKSFSDKFEALGQPKLDPEGKVTHDERGKPILADATFLITKYLI